MENINENMDELVSKANILVEALPYIQRLAGKTIVIKYGGNAMLSANLTSKIMQDIVLLKYIGLNPILVHGGGPDIDQTLKAFDIQAKFHNGLRITDSNTMTVVQMVLSGKINKDLVSQLNDMGGKSIGLCGKDANLITVKKKDVVDDVDLGYVGDITGINKKLLDLLASDEYIPVIAPIGSGPNGESYNINADTAAAAIAAAMGAEKLIYLTDIDGVRTDPKNPDTLIHDINRCEIEKMIQDGTIAGGMIPKVMSCLIALDGGAKTVTILNGTIPHPLLLEIFTNQGIGTMVHQ